MCAVVRKLSASTSVIALAAIIGLAAAGIAMAQDKHGHGAPAGVAAATSTAVSIVRNPADLPGPLAKRGPQRVRVDLETVEITGQLDDGATYRYWTFNRKVPGPFVRVRVGDTVEVANEER